MRGDKVDMCEAIEAMRVESRQKGIDEDRQRVARDMLRKKMFTLPIIAEISKLSEDVIRGIASTMNIAIK